MSDYARHGSSNSSMQPRPAACPVNSRAFRRAAASSSSTSSSVAGARPSVMHSNILSVCSTIWAIPRNPILRSRKLSTAISFAAFRMVGVLPPACKAVAGEAQAGKTPVIRLFERHLIQIRQIQAPGWRSNPMRPTQRMRDRRLHVRRRQMRQNRSISIGYQAMHDRWRMHDDIELLRREPNRT